MNSNGMSIEDHVRRLFREVPESDRKKQIMREIIHDLEERSNELISEGKTEEDAVNKVLVDFGDIGELKKELSGKNRSRRVKNAGLALGFSIWGSLLIIALCLFINFYYVPDVIWFVYPTFAVLWWPLALFYRWLRLKREVETVE